MVGSNRDLALFCRAGRRLCALPAALVDEVMRRLPIDPMPGAPPFVLGLSIIRGRAAPVVDLALLLGENEARPAYYVSTLLDDRRVAIAIDGVLGVRPITNGALQALPSLIGSTASEFVARLGTLDDELLLVLSNARLVPQQVWDDLGIQGSVA
jgi:purine-binding chemotaxis protein CheW